VSPARALAATGPGHPSGPDRAAHMRADFDAGFARRPRDGQDDLTDVLALRVGDDEVVLRLGEIAELIARPVLTPVPSTAPALIGLTASRGAPVAAYDLAVLLGRARTEPRWMVIAAAEPGAGLTFEHFGGYRRIRLGSGHAHRLVEVAALVEEIRHLGAARPPAAHPRAVLESDS
jgi:chemotaxis signal transduction protein